MAEPKKETVRIVLPARRDGPQVASSPRETAMINLPPKPVPAPSPVGSAPSIPKPPGAAPSIPKPPTAPPPAAAVKPPGAPVPPPAVPSVPRPPSASVPPVAPKPPGAPVPPPAAASSVPVAPKAPVPPASGSPSIGTKPVPAPIPAAAPAVAPAPVRAETKKETAKVPVANVPTKPLPQATVQLQRKPEGSTPKSVSTSAPLTVVPDNTQSATDDVNPILGVAALVVALAALGVQVWMMMG